LLDFEPETLQTDISEALRFMTNVIKKRCTAFLISDFIDDGDLQDALTIANRKHDLVAVQVYDHRDAELPDMGLVKMCDTETGHRMIVDTSSKAVRAKYRSAWSERQFRMRQMLRKAGVNGVSMESDDDYVKMLKQMFSMTSVSMKMGQV